jgi:hypothetical protein
MIVKNLVTPEVAAGHELVFIRGKLIVEKAQYS